MIDNIIDNNFKNRKSKTDKVTGEKTWEYSDNRGNTVVLNDNDGIVTVFSPADGGVYIPKRTN